MSFPNKSGTIAQIVEILIETWGENTMGAETVMHVADKMGLFQRSLYAGPERTADRERLLTRTEVERLRSVFADILRAIDELPPEAVTNRDGLRLVEGGGA